MAIFTNEAGKTPLMDADMSAAIRRRLTEVWALAFLALACGLGAALWSYNLGDPSPCNASPAPASTRSAGTITRPAAASRTVWPMSPTTNP